MKYVLSTMTNAVAYRTYKYIGSASDNTRQSLLPIPVRTILIRGGAGMPHRHSGFGDRSQTIGGDPIWTPQGVVTAVEDDEYEVLKDHWLFKKHLDAGVLTVMEFDVGQDHDKISKIVTNARMGDRDLAAPLNNETLANRVKVNIGNSNELRAKVGISETHFWR